MTKKCPVQHLHYNTRVEYFYNIFDITFLFEVFQKSLHFNSIEQVLEMPFSSIECILRRPRAVRPSHICSYFSFYTRSISSSATPQFLCILEGPLIGCQIIIFHITTVPLLARSILRPTYFYRYVTCNEVFFRETKRMIGEV